MSHLSHGLDPDAIRIIEACLASAEQKASAYRPVDARLRSTLAVAVLQGWDQGVHDPAALVEFAMRVLPAARDVET